MRHFGEDMEVSSRGSGLVLLERRQALLLSFREGADGQWTEERRLEGHKDWVRDVAWAPSIGLPHSTIASCSQVSFFNLDVDTVFGVYTYRFAGSTRHHLDQQRLGE